MTVVLANGPVGIMQASMDIVVPYIHDRKQFGQVLVSSSLFKARSPMYSQMNASRAYLYLQLQCL